MNIPFRRIMLTAKRQTGYNFPMPEMVEKQMQEGEAAQMVHQAACQVQFQNPDHIVPDDDPCHYAIESIIVAACMELYGVEIDRHELSLHRR